MRKNSNRKEVFENAVRAYRTLYNGPSKPHYALMARKEDCDQRQAIVLREMANEYAMRQLALIHQAEEIFDEEDKG